MVAGLGLKQITATPGTGGGQGSRATGLPWETPRTVPCAARPGLRGDAKSAAGAVQHHDGVYPGRHALVWPDEQQGGRPHMTMRNTASATSALRQRLAARDRTAGLALEAVDMTAVF